MKNSLSASIIKTLQQKASQYNHIDFIEADPISIPHKFSLKQDIEIAAFFAATFSWGNRKYILQSAQKFMQLMNNSPYEYIMTKTNEAFWFKNFEQFTHRTFNVKDACTFLSFLQHHYYYCKQESLETAFTQYLPAQSPTVEPALNGFYNYFFSQEIHGNNAHEIRKKHLGAPFKKSACKRMNMFLRWMVRADKNGVDFGLWKNISTSQLIIPLDVHVLNVAINLQLLPANAKANWENAVALTNMLKTVNANDPVLYDYALFSMGVNGKK